MKLSGGNDIPKAEYTVKAESFEEGTRSKSYFLENGRRKWIQEKSEKLVVEWLDSEKPRYSLATKAKKKKKKSYKDDRRIEVNKKR